MDGIIYLFLEAVKSWMGFFFFFFGGSQIMDGIFFFFWRQSNHGWDFFFFFEAVKSWMGFVFVFLEAFKSWMGKVSQFSVSFLQFCMMPQLLFTQPDHHCLVSEIPPDRTTFTACKRRHLSLSGSLSVLFSVHNRHLTGLLFSVHNRGI